MRDRLFVGAYYAAASILSTWILFRIFYAPTSSATSDIASLFKKGDLASNFLALALIGVVPLIIGTLMGAPPRTQTSPPGPVSYIMRGILVAVLSNIIYAIILTFLFVIGFLLLMMLPFSLFGGAVFGGLLYLIRGSKLRQGSN